MVSRECLSIPTFLLEQELDPVGNESPWRLAELALLLLTHCVELSRVCWRHLTGADSRLWHRHCVWHKVM